MLCEWVDVPLPIDSNGFFVNKFLLKLVVTAILITVD